MSKKSNNLRRVGGIIISRSSSILIIPGVGIGPEVMLETIKVIKATGAELDLYNISGIEEAHSNAAESFLTDSYLFKCEAIIIGALGRDLRPLDALSRNILSHYYREKDIYANIRPLKTIPGTPERVNKKSNEIDIFVVREFSEGFSPNHEGYSRGSFGVDKRIISDFGARRIAKYAFEYATRNGRSRVTCVDQSNWLHSDKIFRRSFTEMSRRYPSIKSDCHHVDVAAMMVSHNPEEFDVIVTPNMYGDILSGIVINKIGGIGMAPSAFIGGDFAVFEPIHGMAMDIAGKGIANPIASILSARLMLEWLGMNKEAWMIDRAVTDVVAEGKVLTRDMGGSFYTWDIGDAITNRILLMMNEKSKYEKKLHELTEKKMGLEKKSVNTLRRTDVIIEEREPR